MDTKQEVLKALRSYTVKLTDKQIDEVVWLVDMEEQCPYEAIDSVLGKGYIDPDDIDLDY